MATSYTRFSDNDQVNSIDRVFASAWSGGENELTAAFSSSTQYHFTTATTAVTSSAAFFMEIYDKNPQTDTTAEVTYYLLKSYSLGATKYLVLDDAFVLGFNNRVYALFIEVGGSDTVDVLIGV